MLVRDDTSLQLLNAETGEQVGQSVVLDTENYLPSAVSPDSRWIVVWGSSNYNLISEDLDSPGIRRAPASTRTT